MTKIGRNIKKIRSIKSLSQQAFGELFGLTRGNISSYEEFRAEPKIETLVRIAKYFGIPLSEIIEKELSVNDLVHYNTSLVLDTDKLRLSQQLVKIPYLTVLYIQEYIKKYRNEDFLNQLPQITLPTNSRFSLLAIEIENRELLPAGFNYQNGDILVFEEIVPENIHRIEDKFGCMIDKQGIFYGVFKSNESQMELFLNAFVSYPFELNGDAQYWMLKGVYQQI